MVAKVIDFESRTKGHTKKQTSQEEHKESRDEVMWWNKAIWAAQEAEYGATCSISERDRINPWGRSDNWIYDRFARLGDVVLSGISSERLRESMQACPYTHTERDHPPLWLRPGSKEYIRLVKRVGLADVRERQHAFLDGFADTEGNLWCGSCFMRSRLIDAAKSLGSPDAERIYRCPETKGITGPCGWSLLVMTASPVLVEILVRMIEQKKEERS